VALLVLRDVAHALAEAGQQIAALEVVADEVLTRLRQRRLDDEVVHRHGTREGGARAVLAQHAGDLVEHLERLAEAPGELGLGGGQRAGDRAVAALDDLLHEAMEEDRVARLVDLLGGQEVLLLLARRGVDERREVVGDRVLAVEEHRVVPEGCAALELGEVLAPLPAVRAQVDLRGPPVAALPARVQVRVGDLVHRAAHLMRSSSSPARSAIAMRSCWRLSR
jgi:hypothetical protein